MQSLRLRHHTTVPDQRDDQPFLLLPCMPSLWLRWLREAKRSRFGRAGVMPQAKALKERAILYSRVTSTAAPGQWSSGHTAGACRRKRSTPLQTTRSGPPAPPAPPHITQSSNSAVSLQPFLYEAPTQHGSSWTRAKKGLEKQPEQLKESAPTKHPG